MTEYEEEDSKLVALFTRAWIEIYGKMSPIIFKVVALFTRAWIEIDYKTRNPEYPTGRPLHEGVD